MVLLQRLGKSHTSRLFHFINQVALQRTLFFVCAGNELFFVSLYLIKWVSTPIGFTGYYVEELTWPQLTALCTFPIFALKNIINIVQLWKASKILVGVDLSERAAEREGKKRK